MDSSIAKINRPTVTGVLFRERLFRILEQGRERPVIWVSGPAGSGKTTLIASYLDAFKLPCLWYQVDEGDADVATFFYYMGLAAKKAAPRNKKPLPLLTPEYLLGITTFSRRFFEELYGRLKTPFVIVFDNYQGIPEESPFHEVIQHGLSAIPKGITVVMISRGDPPSAFARLRASKGVEIIGWDHLRLMPDEEKEIIELHAKGRLPRETVAYVRKKAEGWAAGLVLLIENAKTAAGTPQSSGQIAPEEVFNYFAGEIFNKLDSETRDFLLMTSFLPKMTARTAEKLTDEDNAGSILAGLTRNYFFTVKHAAPEPVYQYHSLFREFLLTRMKESLSPEGIIHVQKQAAALLEESGQIEDAVRLLHEAKDWEGTVRLILGHAHALMTQGRGKTLHEWLAGIPSAVGAKHVWLCYWTGVCAMAFDPMESRKQFEQAFTRFRAAQDLVGTHLAWAGVVDTFVYEGNDYHGAEEWIAWLDGRARERIPFPSPEVEARSAASMAHLLLWRQTGHPDIKAWIERSVVLSEAIPDLTFQVQVRSISLLYAVWMGEISDCLMIIDDIKRRVRTSTFSPLAMILWKAMEAVYCASIFNSERALLLVSEGLAIARAHGVHVIDSVLIAQGVYASLNKNDETLAKQYFEMMRVASPAAHKNYYGNYQNLLAWRHLQTGNIPEAVACAETSLALAEEIGTPVPIIVTRLASAQAVHAAGDRRKADRLLARAKEQNDSVGSHYLAFVCGLVEAYFAFSRDDDNAGLRALSRAMALGRQKGLVSMHFIWRPDVMAPLCARALAAGIETEYARKLIHDLRLAGCGPPHEESWPWPLKVITLGRFEALSNDTPLRVEQKSARRPIELLKAIVSLGEAGADKAQLIEALWPDAEGDAGNHAFETALYRLRKLLNSGDAITLKNNQLTVDLRYCWSDAWAFERMLESSEFRDFDELSRVVQSSVLKDNKKKSALRNPESAIEKVIKLYKGQFLPGEAGAWAVSYRERLRDKFLRVVTGLSRHWEQAGKWKKAVECYRKGLEADPLAEEFYQGLMTGYDRLGYKAEAVKTYQRCRDTLKSSLGMELSPRTEAIHQAIRENR